jgi:formylglycine-generating enzyme required for sulfatase activity
MNRIDQSVIEREREALYRELQHLATPHQRRLEIGERLAEIGDTRDGIGLKDGLPDVAWLPVDGSGGRYGFEYGEFEIQPFFIARYQTTFSQYQVFIDSGEYDSPRWWDGFPDNYCPQDAQTPHNSSANVPRDTVSWYQSMAFARWMTAKFDGLTLSHPAGAALCVGDNAQIRLPTEWEWQWAAQAGTKARYYPWGEWDEHPRANTAAADLDDETTAVGMYPHGAAACGALDMGGNLWEWCLNDRDSLAVDDFLSGKSRILRGGSCANYYDRESAATTYRNQDLPQNGFYRFGVRLAVGLQI